MLTPAAARFILEHGSGTYQGSDAQITMTESHDGMHLDLAMGHNRISGNLLDAFVDEFGDLSLVFPESDIKVCIQREVPA